MKDYEVFTFPNGIRLIHKQVVHTKIAHCGFVLNIGSRDEKPEQAGIAHFWEHMAFKGTTNRKSYHIINSLESVGGELNAYTTKEKICFYASLLDVHFERAVDVLTDITFNATFPEKEIVKERGVILEEMRMYEDDPADALSDEFDALIFGPHALGMNIAGTVETVSSFTRDNFRQFIKENFHTGEMAFTSVSSLPFEKVLKVVSKYVANVPTASTLRQRSKFEVFRPQLKQLRKPVSQSHCAIGRTAYHLYDDRRLAFFMLVNILGGPGMNSRLNMAIRERYGFVYSIDATFNSYIDTGLFGIYFATEPARLDKCIDLIHKELRLLRDKPMGVLQLHTAKQQLMGQLAMAEESNVNMMLMLGKSLLDLEKIESLSDIFAHIAQISAAKLQDLANEMFDPDQLSMLQFLPEEA